MGVKIVETCLRDGTQSLFATRMTTDEIVEIAKELDNAGYYAMEVWGGATRILRYGSLGRSNF